MRPVIRLARAVERVLDEQWQTKMWLDVQREGLVRREAQRQAKAEDRFWQQRDAGRRAQQPVHVEVDPNAWNALKAKSKAQNRTVGATLVGHLVSREVHRCPDNKDMAPRPGEVGEDRQDAEQSCSLGWRSQSPTGGSSASSQPSATSLLLATSASSSRGR